MIEAFFFTAGLIVFLGFFSLFFFERTKIPDVLILMVAGVLVNQFFGFVNSQMFVSFAPYVGAIALMILLFEGGINLKIKTVLHELPTATGFTLAVFVLSCLLVAIIMPVFFGWSILRGLLLGAVVGGTSSAIVVSLVSKLPVPDCFKILLTLESTLTDALCIIAAIAIGGIILSGYADFRGITTDIISAFSIASLLALLFGLAWMKILARFHDLPFGYLLTVAVIFLLYSLVEYSNGNGAIAAFAFGLVLGNAKEIGIFLRMPGNFVFTEKIKSFNEEASFFTRTFFFVYLGLLFNPEILSGSTIIISIILLLVLIAARFIPTYFMMKKNNEIGSSGILLGTMMPRGLAAAVLATNPEILEAAVFGLGTNVEILKAASEEFTGIAVLIIIFTNIMATIGAFMYDRRRNGNGETQLIKSRTECVDAEKEWDLRLLQKRGGGN